MIALFLGGKLAAEIFENLLCVFIVRADTQCGFVVGKGFIVVALFGVHITTSTIMVETNIRLQVYCLVVIFNCAIIITLFAIRFGAEVIHEGFSIYYTTMSSSPR